MAFIQLGGNSRVDEMILARVSSGFAGEKVWDDIQVVPGFVGRERLLFGGYHYIPLHVRIYPLINSPDMSFVPGTEIPSGSSREFMKNKVIPFFEDSWKNHPECSVQEEIDLDFPVCFFDYCFARNIVCTEQFILFILYELYLISFLRQEYLKLGLGLLSDMSAEMVTTRRNSDDDVPNFEAMITAAVANALLHH
ncbi:hypothetical protein Tco_0617953 [Tanacetum coccineum]